MPQHPRLIVGISGASGAIYGARLLQLRQPLPVETHLVMSRSAELTLALETGLKPAEIRGTGRRRASDRRHGGGRSRRGSFPTLGMIVAPCSIRSMAEIATGATTDVADPRRRCRAQGAPPPGAAGARDPAHTGHLRTMTALSEMGAIIAPPVSGLLRQAADPRRPDRPDAWPHARPVRPRLLGIVRRWGEESAAEPGQTRPR